MASRMAPGGVSPFGIDSFNHEYQPLPPLRFQPRMLIAFNISVEGLRQEFAEWPEFVAKVELMKFKRYYAYVYASSIHDPLGVWNGPDRPPGIPAERLRIALIGPERPRLAYFNKTADSLHPDERMDIKKLEIIGGCLNPSPRGPEQRWMIMDEDEKERFEEFFIEDQGRIEELEKEYHRQHPDEPEVWYTLEDGKLLLDGIDINLGLAYYSVPVDAFLDLDDQDKIEDPCDFEAEVSAVRRHVELSN
ncbi:hypothetical protein FS837_011669 [Tulasnella sp. UAMH 9824]|nr:hypothetical protein FS837_011669 [Tulasnella sp. UAMH 9824]